MSKLQVRPEEFGAMFEWEVPSSGYCVGSPDPEMDAAYWGRGLFPGRVWREPFPSPGTTTEPDQHPPWLIEADMSQGHREYCPLTEEMTLYRTFAVLQLETSELLAFANRYGCLLRGQLLLTSPELNPEHLLVGGESLWLWAEEINAMREAVALVDAIRNAESTGEEGQLTELIHWRKNRVAFNPGAGLWGEARVAKALPGMTLLLRGARRRLRAPSGPEEITIPLVYDPRFKAWAESRDRVGPAKEYLTMITNKRIRGSVSPQLQMVEDRSSGLSLRTSLVPSDLLGAMWLQLLQDFAGLRRVRECLVCGKPFDAVDDPRQIYCRTRASGCRKKADRIRGELEAGQPLREVASRHKIPVSRLQALLERSERSKKAANP